MLQQQKSVRHDSGDPLKVELEMMLFFFQPILSVHYLTRKFLATSVLDPEVEEPFLSVGRKPLSLLEEVTSGCSSSDDFSSTSTPFC